MGKNSLQVVGLDQCGAIALRQEWSRGRIEARSAAMASSHMLRVVGHTRMPLPWSDSSSRDSAIHSGDAYSIVFRQLADGRGGPPPRRASPPDRREMRPRAAAVAAPVTIGWRRVDGAAQFALAISTKQQLLLSEERLLAVLRWIGLKMPRTKRWYPMLEHYIDQVAYRVRRFGGDPGQIEPSPTGDVRGLPHPWRCDEVEVCGKIDGIMFDHFGDFEGFILESESGPDHRFYSREASILRIVRRAWRERTRVTLITDANRSHGVRSVILEAGERSFPNFDEE
jgi:hypothetical protein